MFDVLIYFVLRVDAAGEAWLAKTSFFVDLYRNLIHSSEPWTGARNLHTTHRDRCLPRLAKRQQHYTCRCIMSCSMPTFLLRQTPLAVPCVLSCAGCRWLCSTHCQSLSPACCRVPAAGCRLLFAAGRSIAAGLSPLLMCTSGQTAVCHVPCAHANHTLQWASCLQEPYPHACVTQAYTVLALLQHILLPSLAHDHGYIFFSRVCV